MNTRRIHRSFQALALIAAMGSAGCEGGEGGSEPDDLEERAPDIASAQGYLAEGRQVQIKPAGVTLGADGKYPLFDPRTTATGIKWSQTFNGQGKDSWLDLVAASCDYQTRSVYGNNRDTTVSSLPACPGGNCADAARLDSFGMFNVGVLGEASLPAADENSPLRGWTNRYSSLPYITQAALMCTGQRLLEMSKSLLPTVFRGRETAANSGVYDWIVAGYETDEWPQSWRDQETLLANSATVNNRRFRLPPLNTFKELFAVPSPTADEAATWSLIAIDFLRESAILGVHGLTTLAQTDLQGTAQLADGAVVTLEQMMLGNTSDALMAMQDASEWAERYVGAATPKNPDRKPVDVWTARIGSRLEAARTFTAVPATAFEGHGLIPLYRMVNNGSATDIAETTDPSGVYARWGSVKATQTTVAWVYPAYMPPPVGALAIYQYERKDAGVIVDTVACTAELAAVKLPLGVGSTQYSKGAILGYVLPAADASNANLLPMRLVATTASPPTYTAVVNGAGTDIIGYVHVAPAQGKNIPAPSLAAQYPTVSALSETNLDRIAEKKLRALRASPICLAGHPKCRICPAGDLTCLSAGYSPAPAACTCARYGDFDIDRIVTDMRLLEKSSRLNIGDTNDSDWLKAQPFGKGTSDIEKVNSAKANLLIAAKRVAQQAAVLGHSIEPMGAALQNLTNQVVMVSGTQLDYRPVEPTYLQALTDGASQQFVSDAEDRTGVTVTSVVTPKLRGQFARRGLYHTALFVRRALDNYTPTAGLTPTRDKLRAWLGGLVDGWLRVAFSTNAYTPVPTPSGTTAVPRTYTITVFERELADTNGSYEVWKGEAGLECALSGAISGLACNESDYRVGVPSDAAPNGANSSQGRLVSGTWQVDDRTRAQRLFVTKSLGRARQAVAGLTLPELAASKTIAAVVPMMSSAMRDAYTRTLAADPTASYRAEQYCGALIDYDTRVKLSDEITRSQGATGELSDSVEYYLKRAETASSRSDALGNEVVEFGLSMDTRSEQGIEALEDLCGVQVDANPLGSADDGLKPTQGQAGLASCKAPESDLEWLSVGSKAHCAWRLNATLPPCDCGDSDACKTAKSGAKACPSLPATEANPQNCEVHFESKFNGLKNMGLTYFGLGTLGYSVDQGSQGASALTDIPASAERPEGFKQSDIVGHCDMLAALYAGKYAGNQGKTLNEMRAHFPWLDFDEIRNVATSIGWVMDPYGSVQLTLNGEPWLDAGAFAPNENPGVEALRREVPIPADVPNRQTWRIPGRRNWAKPAGCSRPGTSGLLVCSGDDLVDGTTLGITKAGRAYTALETLEHLTGAAGPREGWTQLLDLGMLNRIASKKEHVFQTEPILTAPWLSLFEPTHNNNYVYWANVDDKKEYFVTDKPQNYPGTFEEWWKIWFLGTRPEWARDPWNWKGAAAFVKEVSEREVDERYDADEFSNSSTLWETVRNTKGGDHTVVEWSYKARRSGFKKFLHGAGRRWVESNVQLSRNELFDAFSLVCLAQDKSEGIRPSTDSCASFFPATPTMLDAANASDCVAEQLSNVVNRLYIPGIPKSLTETLRANDTAQVLPEFAGQYAEAVAGLGAELGIYRSTVQAVARATNEMGYQVRTVRRTIEKIENETQIAEIQLKKDIANQVTACLAAVGQNGGIKDIITSGGTGQIGVAAVCANSVAQGIFSAQITDLQKENLGLSEDQALDDFQENIHDIMGRVDDQLEELRRSHAAIHAHIARMDSIRRQAARAEAKATLSIDAGQGRVNHVNAVMRARMNTTLNRYERAFDQAVRYGYLARRAIEERIGMNLDTMTKDASLTGAERTGGEAPYEWADQICSMKGIDYQAIAGHLKDEDDKTIIPKEDASYAESYVGDYVVRLRDFMDSYRFDYPFQDGSDQVVVSLRDELQNIRQFDCPVEGQNLLLDTAEPSTATGIWECSAPTLVAGVATNCPALKAVAGDTGPFACSDVKPCYPEQTAMKVANLIPPSRAAAGVVQPVYLSAGTHVLSWYERCNMGNPSVDALWGTFDSNPVAVQLGPNACTCGNQAACTFRTTPSGSVWIRRSVALSAPVKGDYLVGLGLPAIAATASITPARVAGVQFERGPVATGYFPTKLDHSYPIGICEDVNGEGFRSWDNWTYRCETYCPAGTGNDCTLRFPADSLPKACFYETRFNISQEQVERGRQIQEAGFARGNFNYRIDQLALNFVGTGVRSCESAELQSACYGGAFLQYSIEQVGPYRVRNHDGELYSARLYNGRIQQAKGLVAERYFTNPLSSADRALVSDYMRSEMKGRPLDGTYLVRVYDNEALQWHALEDIQLLMKYQYWTRLD